MKRPSLFPVLLALFVGGLVVLPLAAQSSLEWDGGREQMSRAELESLLVRLDDAARSTAYSSALRDEARRNAELIRTRLEVGDFQVGDRIVFRLLSEETLSDTLSVRAGPSVLVPDLGEISLRGVLRSELRGHLENELRRFIREPTVDAEPLIRISVYGEVNVRGIHPVSPNVLVTDVLMIAGGPTSLASPDDIRIERSGVRIWEGRSLQEAMVQGRTLDQLNLQAGDQIIVPQEVRRSGLDWLQIGVTVVAPIVSLAVLLATLF